MKKAQSPFLIILIFVLIIIAYLYYPTPGLRVIKAPDNPVPVTKEMQTVSFCGTNYQVEKIMIDDVDIIKRIAELGTQNPDNGICRDVKNNFPFGNRTRLDPKNSNIDEYWLEFSGFSFRIQPKRNKIITVEAFDGENTYIGTVK
jgi:hypothetical protein